MAKKRYMRKNNTCAGHEAQINNKLLCKKPPGIMSAVSVSIVCKQGTSWPLKALRKNKRKKERKYR